MIKKKRLNKISGSVKVAKMKNSSLTPLNLALEPAWQNFFETADPAFKDLVFKLEQIGQLGLFNQIKFSQQSAELLYKQLEQVDRWFASAGGLVGYQRALEEVAHKKSFDQQILQAPSLKLEKTAQDHHEAIKLFLEHLPELAEVYAIGGAADRLNLKAGADLLPAACLKMAGKTLLEFLIHDLEAKEWLYYKFYQKTLTLPIVMMTSFEKGNQGHIYNILQQHQFFHRDKDRFLIFHQPLLPMVDEDLNWQTDNHGGLLLKPGGHGALWSLCLKEGVFSTLKAQGVKKLSVRQINNPIACIDFEHAAFLGYGFKQDASFGFFACQRFALSQEGINVLLKTDKGQYCLTNIEYCQLEDVGVNDVANDEGFSQFPANTNVLFGDVVALEALAKQHPYPGQILNYKRFCLEGTFKNLARLETMMQNIADYIVEQSCPLKKVYMTLSPRVKTISPIKKQKILEGSWSETPQACFYDFMRNIGSLFDQLHVCYSPLESIESYYNSCPAFIVHYLPALGPFFDVIALKWQNGTLAKGAYLDLQIAEVKIYNLELKGALTVKALNPYGYQEGMRIFSEHCGRVELENCFFDNQGVDYQNSCAFYQDQPHFLECCQIILEGFSEFSARDVHFKGSHMFKVPHGYRLQITQNQDSTLEYSMIPITAPSWVQRYEWDAQGRIVAKTV